MSHDVHSPHGNQVYKGGLDTTPEVSKGPSGRGQRTEGPPVSTVCLGPGPVPTPHQRHMLPSPSFAGERRPVTRQGPGPQAHGAWRRWVAVSLAAPLRGAEGTTGASVLPSLSFSGEHNQSLTTPHGRLPRGLWLLAQPACASVSSSVQGLLGPGNETDRAS